MHISLIILAHLYQNLAVVLLYFVKDGKAMYLPERGVLENSEYFFHTSSNMAQAMFFYLKCAGHYFCDENYLVKRDNYGSYLIMYIKSGQGFVTYNDKTYTAKANDVVLLDCFTPHSYYTGKGWETLWIHYGGNTSSLFYELLYNRFGCVLSLENSVIIPKHLNLIIDGFKNENPLPEPIVSCYIQRILAEMLLISSNYSENSMNRFNPVMEAITFIETNFKEKFSLEKLAFSVKLSPFHFSRLFKKETGYSPYEYIIRTRLNQAKTLLKTTGLNIKEIAYEVGFNSESNFVHTFHKKVKLTPKEFRHMPF